MSDTVCRSCGTALEVSFADLGETPLANGFLDAADLARPEPRYPLHVRVCAACYLVQIEALVAPAEMFSAYPYFSSYSATWVDHTRRFSEMARARFGLGAASQVIEVASNDGCLLRHFAATGVPVLGVEPAANVAAVAEAAGIATLVRFFGAELASQLPAADLIVANNVLAHVPELNDFVAGLAMTLKPDGVLSLEFPHIQQLIDEVQFDTIYHEHLCYFSLLALEPVLARHGLRAFDVEVLTTHGGSLRVFACRTGNAGHDEKPGLARVRAAEQRGGLDKMATYTGFSARIAAVKRSLLDFLAAARGEGKRVAAYGAAAKGNTLLNTCGIDARLIDYVVDASRHKQGRYLPGSRLAIHGPEKLAETRPDYVLILPWNLRDEITATMAHIRGWGGRFVVPIPRTEVLP